MKLNRKPKIDKIETNKEINILTNDIKTNEKKGDINLINKLFKELGLS